MKRLRKATVFTCAPKIFKWDSQPLWGPSPVSFNTLCLTDTKLAKPGQCTPGDT